MPGASGALVTVIEHTRVRKVGTLDAVKRRVWEQGCYLKELSHLGIRCIPRVYQVDADDGAYVMERLTPINWSFQYQEKYVKEVLKTLVQFHSHSWEELTRESDQRLWHETRNIDAHRNYVLDRVHHCLPTQTSLYVSLMAVHDTINWDQFPTVITHGDPTLDNCMLRATTGDLVLIDPLPPVPYMPSIRALDFSKVLQSIFGYERIKYGRDPIYIASGLFKSHASIACKEELKASLYLCAVQFLRLLPYQPTQLRPEFTKKITEALNAAKDCNNL